MATQRTSLTISVSYREQTENYRRQSMRMELELTRDGVVKKCDPSCSRILSYSQDELIEMSRENRLLDLIHEGDRRKYQARLQETKVIAPCFDILRVKNKNGSWVHLAYDIRISTQSQNIHLLAEDITPLLKDRLFAFNEVRNLIQRLLAVTDACLAKFDEKSCAEWMIVGDLTLRKLALLLNTSIGSDQNTSMTQDTKSEKRSKAFRVSVVNEAKTSVQNAQDVQDHSTEIHVEVDIKSGKVLSANQTLENVLGYNERVLNAFIANGSEEFYRLLEKGDRKPVEDKITRCKETSFFTVVSLKHRDDDKGFICLGLHSSPNLARGVVHVAAKVLAPYLTGVDTLFHEARNMVRLISAAFTKISEILGGASSVHTKQTVAAEVANHGKLYIWNLLRVLRRQTVAEFLDNRPIATNLVESIDTIIDLLRVEAEQKSLAIETTLPQEALYLLDKPQIEGVLINIITNSIKYTRTGKIGIALNIIKTQDNVKDKLHLAVSDTGVGVPAEKLAYISEVNCSTSESKESDYGTGLGLSIVKQVVEKMGGDISFDSKLDHGTTVTLIIPATMVTARELKKQQEADAKQATFASVSPSDSPSISPVESPRELPQDSHRTSPLVLSRSLKQTTCEPKIKVGVELRGLRVLVVDDVEINTRIVEKMLNRLGCKCTRVSSGEQAIEKLIEVAAQGASPFKIILMDIAMPELDGIETTRCIKTANLAPDAVIIALSGNGSLSDKEKAFNAGMVDFVTKPVSDKKLEAVIKKNLHKTFDAKIDSVLIRNKLLRLAVENRYHDLLLQDAQVSNFERFIFDSKVFVLKEAIKEVTFMEEQITAIIIAFLGDEIQNKIKGEIKFYELMKAATALGYQQIAIIVSFLSEQIQEVDSTLSCYAESVGIMEAKDSDKKEKIIVIANILSQFNYGILTIIFEMCGLIKPVSLRSEVALGDGSLPVPPPVLLSASCSANSAFLSSSMFVSENGENRVTTTVNRAQIYDQVLQQLDASGNHSSQAVRDSKANEITEHILKESSHGGVLLRPDAFFSAVTGQGDVLSSQFAGQPPISSSPSAAIVAASLTSLLSNSHPAVASLVVPAVEVVSFHSV